MECQTERERPANEVVSPNSAPGPGLPAEFGRGRYGIRRADENAQYKRSRSLHCVRLHASSGSNGPAHDPCSHRILVELGPERNAAYHGQGATPGGTGRSKDIWTGILAPSRVNLFPFCGLASPSMGSSQGLVSNGPARPSATLTAGARLSLCFVIRCGGRLASPGIGNGLAESA